MKKISLLIILVLIPFVKLHAFAPKMGFDDKCQKSDSIVQGEVVNIVNLFPEEDQQHRGKISKDNKDYHGPKSVAIVRLLKVFKGDSELMNGCVLVPCQYDTNVSPSEFTKGRSYILFLKTMGNGYFHPLGLNCAHLVINDRVGLSGLDWEGDFDHKSSNGANVSLKEFIENITKSIKSTNKETMDPRNNQQ